MDFPAMSASERLELLEQPAGKLRMVLDTDTYNEIDDQFALVYALINFIGVVAVLKFFEYGEFSRGGRGRP